MKLAKIIMRIVGWFTAIGTAMAAAYVGLGFIGGWIGEHLGNAFVDLMEWKENKN